jgi:hypothetical protein
MYVTPSVFNALAQIARLVRPKIRLWQAALACLLVFCVPARAEVTAADVQVAARALSFVSNPLKGPVRVGIVYAAGNPKSVQQAQSLRSMLGNGLRVGNLELRPVLVKSTDVAGTDVDLFFLTEFMTVEETPRRLGNRTRQSILCVTTDIAQVRRGACVMGVRSRPKVEVFVNQASATANDVSFSTVFRVMITEL